MGALRSNGKETDKRMDIILQTGWIFWLIVFLGLADVILFFQRLLHIRRAQIQANDFLKGIYNVLKNGNAQEAITLCDETPGPTAAVVATAIVHRKGSYEALWQAVDNTGREEISRLERRLASLAVTCQIAPLLGLFGTVIAVIRVVQTINDHAPLVQTVHLTGGLMSALACTAAGILVAIAGHVMYTVLIVRIERIVLEMESAASEIVAFLTQENPKA